MLLNRAIEVVVGLYRFVRYRFLEIIRTMLSWCPTGEQAIAVHLTMLFWAFQVPVVRSYTAAHYLGHSWTRFNMILPVDIVFLLALPFVMHYLCFCESLDVPDNGSEAGRRTRNLLFANLYVVLATITVRYFATRYEPAIPHVAKSIFIIVLGIAGFFVLAHLYNAWSLWNQRKR